MFVISIYSNCNFILETSFCTRVRQRSVKNSMFAFCWNAPHDFLKASVTSYLFTGWIKLNDFFVLMTKLLIYFDLNGHFSPCFVCINTFLKLKLKLYRSEYIRKITQPVVIPNWKLSKKKLSFISRSWSMVTSWHLVIFFLLLTSCLSCLK